MPKALGFLWGGSGGVPLGGFPGGSTGGPPGGSPEVPHRFWGDSSPENGSPKAENQRKWSPAQAAVLGPSALPAEKRPPSSHGRGAPSCALATAAEEGYRSWVGRYPHFSVVLVGGQFGLPRSRNYMRCRATHVIPGPKNRPKLPPGNPPGTAPQKPTNPQNDITFFCD